MVSTRFAHAQHTRNTAARNTLFALIMVTFSCGLMAQKDLCEQLARGEIVCPDTCPSCPVQKILMEQVCAIEKTLKEINEDSDKPSPEQQEESEIATPLWGYDAGAKNSPGFWGCLKPEFEGCAMGKEQSPINIERIFVDKKTAETGKLQLNYKTITAAPHNNGRKLYVSMPKPKGSGGGLTYNGVQYTLEQFHFHWPSEHTFDNEHTAMELHFVHTDKDGNYLVLTSLIEGKKGAQPHPTIGKLWNKEQPFPEPEKLGVEATFNISDLFPPVGKRAYYTYMGSTTSPPCIENTRWIIFKDPIILSQGQVDEYEAFLTHPNNRPVQPFNGRKMGHGQ